MQVKGRQQTELMHGHKGKQASERVILLFSRPSTSGLEVGGGWIMDLNLCG